MASLHIKRKSSKREQRSLDAAYLSDIDFTAFASELDEGPSALGAGIKRAITRLPAFKVRQRNQPIVGERTAKVFGRPSKES